MLIKTITAVLQMDVRNPNDKMIIQTFGISSSSATPKRCISLEITQIQNDFRKIRETGILNVALWGDNTEEIHKLHSLSGKSIFDIEILAKEKDMAPPIGNFLPSPVDIGYEFGSWIRNRKDPNLFATLNFKNAKLINILPVTDKENDQLLYQAKFDGSGSPRVGSFSN